MVKRTVIEGGATLDRDVGVAMRDGVRLMVNVFRAADDRPAPVVMSMTPYGKDAFARLGGHDPDAARWRSIRSIGMFALDGL
jgi:predicted acyl esterase